MGGGILGSSQRSMSWSMEIEEAQVSDMLRTPGIVSYLSIHWLFC